MRPHLEKNFAQILKIGRVIAFLVCLTKIQKRVKKIKKGGLLAIFEYTPKKKLFFSNFQTMRKYHESSKTE